MIDKRDFKTMVDELKQADSGREETIKKSRGIVRLSKQIIYSIHRGNPDEESIKKIKKATSNIKLTDTGAFKVAMQEYVEALCFYGFVRHSRLLTRKELNVDVESYLLGICDLTGELVRKAINSSIEGDYSEAEKIRGFVSELYGELIKFDFRNSDLRRKFDRVKYDLIKLENLELEIKLRKNETR